MVNYCNAHKFFGNVYLRMNFFHNILQTRHIYLICPHMVLLLVLIPQQLAQATHLLVLLKSNFMSHMSSYKIFIIR